MKRFVFLLIFLVGCQGFSFGGSETPVPKITDLLVGTQGLVMNFISLPTSMLMCQNSDIVVEMRNIGASNIEGVYVFIVEESVFKPQAQKSGALRLEGKTQFNPQGTTERKILRINGQSLPSQLETYTTPIIIQACYPYKTFVSAQVCLNSRADNQGSCATKPVIFSAGQGAPVAVTKVETRMLPEGNGVRPMVILSVANVGNGRIVSKDQAISVCSGSKDKVKSELTVSAKLAGLEMDCLPKVIPFETGKDVQVMCTAKGIFSQESFETVFTAEVEYGYISTLTQQVVVSRLQNQPNCI